MAKPALEVHHDGTRVALLREDRRGRLVCRYSEEVLDTRPGGQPLLSCSLPVQRAEQDATAWCRGILPEGQHLDSLAARAGVLTTDTYGLLARYGRDIAGAFEIAPPEQPERNPSVEAYTPPSLERELAELDSRSLGVYDDSELSLAGLQDKLLVVAAGGYWARPRHGHPSTHLIKLDHRIHAGLIDAECAALEIARSIGLTSIDPRIETIGAMRALVVSRFDRRAGADGTIARVHQEDLLQALGVAPQGRAKYQATGDSGPPSWWHLADLLDRYSDNRLGELERLLRAAVFTTVIGNADGHAKNFALLHSHEGSVSLAPLYDTVPTALWPQLRREMALSINDVNVAARLTVDDFVAEAKRWRMNARTAREVVRDAAEQIDAAAATSSHDRLAALVQHNTTRLLV